MLGSTLRYVLQHPGRAAAALADPVTAWDTFTDRIVQNREYRRGPCKHEADPEWERKLAAVRDTSSDNGLREFQTLWPKVIADVEAQGLTAGPMSFHGYNDGDAGFVRAIWHLIGGLEPLRVVETGVAHGFTSRFILEALNRNAKGHLYSIDCPPLDPEAKKQIGVAVGNRFADRWSLIFGTSRRQLPPLLNRLGQIDLFIHDSRHTEQNVRFELECVWPRLRAGGAMVVDDIDTNWGFDSFTKAHSGYAALICEAEPVRPDPRRFNQKGLFGIILKNRAT
jgi:hypothetical protein